MPFNGNLPAKGTNPWYTPFSTVWDSLKTFVNGLETEANTTKTDLAALQTQVDGLEPGGPVAWSDITSKPTTFPPSAHTHVIADVTSLQETLDTKATTAALTTVAGVASNAQTDASSALSGLALKANTADLGSAASASISSFASAAQGAKADSAVQPEAIANFVPDTRLVAGHPLSENVTVTKGDVGLASVDNTSDANKPVSSAQQTALDAKVPTTRAVAGHALTADVARAGLNTLGVVEGIFLPNGAAVPGTTPVYSLIIESA